MYLAYLKERYNDWDFYPLTMEEVAKRFETLQEAVGHKLIKTADGFISYELSGDAVILHDMYVKPDSRGHTKAWDLHNKVINEARKAAKRVAITYSGHGGKNHIKGIRAMEVSGFVPAFSTEDRLVFIKGI